jgi:hypothetical protein
VGSWNAVSDGSREACRAAGYREHARLRRHDHGYARRATLGEVETFTVAVVVTLLALLPALALTLLLIAGVVRRRKLSAPRTERCMNVVNHLMAWMPCAFLVMFAVIISVAWMRQGERPSVPHWNPFTDVHSGGPYTREYEPFRSLCWLLGLSSLLSIVIAPATFTLGRALGRPMRGDVVRTYFAGFVLVFVCIWFDPLGVMSWLTDS